MKSLPEYRIRFDQIPSKAAPVDLERLGERSKLGGKPDWEQESETPFCPHCGEEMTFIAQIDSFNHDSETNPHRIDCLSDEPRYMFGDVGKIYIFFCFECCEPKAVFQCG